MHSIFLRYLDEVARQGSIRKAATVLNVASTSINRKILSVEENLGVQLFSRTSDGVELTYAGTVMLEHCRKTLLDYEQVRLQLGDIRDMRFGHISIAAIDSVAVDLLPQALAQFEQDHPNSSFSITVASPENVVAAVARGKADIGLSFLHELHPDVRALAEKAAPIGLVMRSDHPLAERRDVALDDLVGYPLIRTPDARGHASIIDRLVSDATLAMPASLFTNSLSLAREMILRGRGVGLYTKLGFLSDIAAGQLRFTPFSSSALNDLKFGLIVTARSPLEPAKRLMCNAITAKLRSVDLSS